MSLTTCESGGYATFSASGNVWAQPAAMRGIFISGASNTPTLTVYDDPATGTTTKIIQQFTPVAGTYYPMPAMAMNGINIVIGGTVEGTIFFDPQTVVGG